MAWARSDPTGLIWLGEGYYDRLGHFLSQDPISFHDLNGRYASHAYWCCPQSSWGRQLTLGFQQAIDRYVNSLSYVYATGCCVNYVKEQHLEIPALRGKTFVMGYFI